MRRKFAIVYHTDNFYVRVAKVIDNVYGLLGLVVGLDIEGRVGTREARDQVEHGLYLRRLKPIAAALNVFERDSLIERAVEARHRFVHHYREEPKWKLLHPLSRLHDAMAGDEMAEQVRRLTEQGDLDRYADQKGDELERTLSVIQAFRDKLHEALGDLDPMAKAAWAFLERFVKEASDAAEGDRPGPDESGD